MKFNSYISEFIGTFVLVFAGTGAIIANDLSGGAVSHVGIALAFGLAVLAMIYTIGDISGAHINPAVSLGFTVALVALFAGPFTGASMNPARSIAPALISGHTEHLWLYLVGPLLGVAAAVLLCRVVRIQCCPEVELTKLDRAGAGQALQRVENG